MAFGIREKAKELKNGNFVGKAREKTKKLKEEITGLEEDVEESEEVTEKVEETGSEEGLEKDLSEQRNIFEQFESVEADAEEILTLEEEEIQNLHKGVEMDLKREKQVKSVILAFGDEIKEVENLVSQIEETLQSDITEFNTRCFRQARELGTEGILQVLEEAKEQGVSTGLAGSLGNDIDMLMQENGIDSLEREDFNQLDLGKQVDQYQSRVIELSICLNEVLYELDGRSCVGKKRYNQLETELGEVQELLEKFEEIAREVDKAMKQEKKIEEYVELEADQLPGTVDELREIGEELQMMGQALEEEATEKEISQITEKMSHSNPRKINSEMESEVEKLESNFEKLERHGNQLVSEAEKLEKENEELMKLEKQDEERIRDILETTDNVLEDLKKISHRILHSDKVAITPEEGDREKFNEDPSKIEYELSYGIDQIESMVKTIRDEAQKIEKMEEKEEKMELEITEEDLTPEISVFG
ncbi:MAG: hypothetical protein ABEK10_01840 [Candidatus Nanosalina sp.]